LITAAQKKVVLITGGSRGIGRSLVNRFKQEGWYVATCARSSQSLKGSAADFTSPCDVSQASDVKRFIQQVIERTGKIDTLINNAGLAGSNPLTPDSTDEMWHQVIDVNLHGAYYMCKYVTPYLPDNTGRIINVSSVLGLKGVPDQTAYCAAKHGVIGLTRALALHLAARKITVNAVCPGWVRTEMAAERMKAIGILEASFSTSVPLGRFIEPQEISDYIYQVASTPGFAMITGQALTIDGGALL
jgi:NAD(P)-dependent dehydrogenase (short-subunit alcohol dehydrogenase family)